MCKSSQLSIWELQQLNEIHEFVCDSPIFNVRYGLLHNKVIGHFFFVEKNFKGLLYLDMYVLPTIDEIEHQIGQQIIFM